MLGTPAGTKRLLSVDDDERILAVIADVASGLGFEVTLLSESARFMTTYVRLKPDVITLDIMMPDLDGIEVIRWLSDIGSPARVIIISGNPTFLRVGKKLADVRGALSTSMLTKPFALADLRNALTTAEAR